MYDEEARYSQDGRHKLRRFAEGLAQLSRSRVELFSFSGSMSFDHHQRRTKLEVKLELQAQVI
jgi:hypothetical protein